MHSTALTLVRRTLATGLTLLAMACATSGPPREGAVAGPPEGAIRIAVFNIFELSTTKLNYVDESGRGLTPQVVSAARVIQAVRPDVLVVLEIDHDYSETGAPLERTARALNDRYLSVGDHPITYRYAWAGPCNTGILSGLDLDNNGTVASADEPDERKRGGDSWGYGTYPGQYSMAILSNVPLDTGAARSFQRFRWADLPGNQMSPGLFPPAVAPEVRLSSKSHWDIPVILAGRRLHLLVSHPTPQGFDGPEDRNGRRNFDELRLWSLYLDGSDALVDDAGRRGGLAPDAQFVLLGDLNAAPGRGSKYRGVHAIDQLLSHPRIADQADLTTATGGLRGRPPGPPAHLERATFEGTQGSRLDYVLPSSGLRVVGGGVYWPDPERAIRGAIDAEFASDHRLVWLDVVP